MASAIDYAEKEPHASIVKDGPIDGVATASDDRVRRMSVIPGIEEVTDAAIAGTEAEKNMSILDSFRIYPKATGWSILLSTALVMEGYDTILLSNLFGFPSFTSKFGTYDAPSATYQIQPSWQAALACGANVGEILGLFATGLVADRFGYRYTLIGALILVVAFIFLLFFAQNLQTLLAGEILCGIPWGVFQTLTTTYAAEVAPVPLRPFLTTYVNLCWVFGQIIASGVLRSFVARTDDMAWRIPYAIQWMWPVPIIVGVFLAPESPWWLVRKGRNEDAKHSLLRLTSLKRDTNFNPDDTIAMMIHTNELEADMSRGTSYWDCFKGHNLRRTEITCITWAIQALCGSAFMVRILAHLYNSLILTQAGLLDIFLRTSRPSYRKRLHNDPRPIRPWRHRDNLFMVRHDPLRAADLIRRRSWHSLLPRLAHRDPRHSDLHGESFMGHRLPALALHLRIRPNCRSCVLLPRRRDAIHPPTPKNHRHGPQLL